MARIRTIKPDFFRHELLQDLEIAHAGKCPMLVFAGLWGHCDKNGVFLWRPKQLKLDILPFMPFEMADTLNILEAAALIDRYSVDGVEYGRIGTFTTHQAIGGKEAQQPGKYPGKNGEVTGKQQGSDRDNPQQKGEASETAGIRKGMEKGRELGTASSPQLSHIGASLPKIGFKKFG